MTNFFGSVMETIHTDSAYKVLSRKTSSRPDNKMSPDKSIDHNQRKLVADSDGADQINVTKPVVKLLNFPFSVFYFLCQKKKRSYLHKEHNAAGSTVPFYTVHE